MKKIPSICPQPVADGAVPVITVGAHADARALAFPRMHTGGYAHNQHTELKTHSVQRRANQLSNRLSVLIFIMRLRTYGSAFDQEPVCVSVCVCNSDTRTQAHREAGDISQEGK